MLLESINTVYNYLYAMMRNQNSGLSAEEIDAWVLNEIAKSGGLQFYVQPISFELKDLLVDAKVTPFVKYFKKYEAAKIYQLRCLLLELEECEGLITPLHRKLKDGDVEKMKKQLVELIEKYPEYAI